MKQYQNIIHQCENAIKSIKSILASEEYQECLDYVTVHNEWLLGLEFAIDWLVEDDRKITEEHYKEFEKAYSLMGLETDVRLQQIKAQIEEK